MIEKINFDNDNLLFNLCLNLRVDGLYLDLEVVNEQ